MFVVLSPRKSKSHFKVQVKEAQRKIKGGVLFKKKRAVVVKMFFFLLE